MYMEDVLIFLVYNWWTQALCFVWNKSVRRKKVLDTAVSGNIVHLSDYYCKKEKKT